MAAFFARRWRGEASMRIVLWRDMLAVGTAVNILATFVALITTSQGGPTWAAAAILSEPVVRSGRLLAAWNQPACADERPVPTRLPTLRTLSRCAV